MVRREWRPGVMHAVIFIGFLSLLLRKLQLNAIGFDENASFPQNASVPVISTITWVPTVATKPAAMPSPTSVSTDQRALGRVGRGC